MSGEPHDAFRRAVGATVHQLRTERGWSLGALGDRAGLSVSYLSELEHGLKEPSGATLEALAGAFARTLAELLDTISHTLQPRPSLPPATLHDLNPQDLAELSRYADWLRWQKQQR